MLKYLGQFMAGFMIIMGHWTVFFIFKCYICILIRDSTAELQNKIDQLQFQVKKLGEQNGKLQKQLEATEDNNAQLVTLTDELKHQVRRYVSKICICY